MGRQIILICCLLTLITVGLFAQAPFGESVTAKTSLMPNTSDVGIFKAAFSMPVAFKILGEKSGAFILSSGYSFTSLNYKKSSQKLEFENEYHYLFLNLMFIKPFNERKSLMIMLIPTVESDFSQSINSKNLGLTGMVLYSIRNPEKKTVTSLGLVYNVHLGINFPFPILFYSRDFAKKWSYTVGFQNEIRYSLTNRNSMGLYLKPDGFRGYVGKTEIDEDSDHIRVDHQSLLGGLNYRKRIGNNFALTLEVGYTMYNAMNIKNYDNKTLLDFGIDRNFYFGISISLIQ